MKKTTRNSIILDTSELIKSLDALAKPRKDWEQGNMFSSLRFCYHLMTRDTIVFDGSIRGENEKLINSSLLAIKKSMGSDIHKELTNRLKGEVFLKSDEKELMAQSIKDAANYFGEQPSRIKISLESIDYNFKSLGSGLTEIDKYLINPCEKGYSSQNLLDNIFDKKEITGRRFYVAIFENPKVLARVKKLIKEGKVNPQDFNLMFAFFRTKLSEAKSIKLEKSGMYDTCFYEPDKLRTDLLMTIPLEADLKVNHAKVLDEGMYRVWLAKNNCLLKEANVDIPSILNLPLQENNKSSFLEKVLSFKDTNYKVQYDKALEILSQTKIENLDETRKNLEIALRSAHGKSALISDSSNWVFISETQDLLKYFYNTSKELFNDLTADGSTGTLVGALGRMIIKTRGKGIRSGTKIHRFFRDKIITLSKENRKVQLDKIFD